AIRRFTGELRHSHGLEVQIRVGLNSGAVVVGAIGSDLQMDYTAVGQTTHLAARMERLAAPGTVRLTADTLRLAEGYIAVKALGPMPVKGVPHPVEVYELTGAAELRGRLHAARARGLTHFVGRQDEIAQMQSALAQARAGQGQIIAVVGEPGVGKSRLFFEFVHSPPYGWLARRRGKLGLLRQGDALSALDRSAQGVFQDRSARQRACRASESDGPDPRARRSAQAGGAGGALADRGAGCRRSRPCARAPAAAPAHPCRGPAPVPCP